MKVYRDYTVETTHSTYIQLIIKKNSDEKKMFIN